MFLLITKYIFFARSIMFSVLYEFRQGERSDISRTMPNRTRQFVGHVLSDQVGRFEVIDSKTKLRVTVLTIDIQPTKKGFVK